MAAVAFLALIGAAGFRGAPGALMTPLRDEFDWSTSVMHGRVSRLTVLVALGTHSPMSDAALAAHLGYPAGRLEEVYPGTTVLTPVRALINDGAALIPARKLAFSVVTANDDHASNAESSGLHSISFGDTIPSWASAAEISARPTSPTSTRRFGRCCRSSPRCTTTSGPAPRVSTSSNPWSPTAVR